MSEKHGLSPRPPHEVGNFVQRPRGYRDCRADRTICALLDYSRAGELLSCVDPGRIGQRISRRRNAVSHFSESQRDAHRWQDCRHACWVRRVGADQFQVFAINCAHLGCPVRWFPQSGLFMCPCHGGAYYRDGSRASGPPERGLFEYPYKVENGLVTIQAANCHAWSADRCSRWKETAMRLISQIGECSTSACSLLLPFAKPLSILCRATRQVGFMCSAAPR